MTAIYNIVKAKITTDDLDAFKYQAKKMTDAAKDETGTLIYEIHINEETKEVLILEKYTNDQSFMEHMDQFTQPEYIPKLLEMQEISSIEMMGKVTSQIENLFAQGGWSYNAYPMKI